MKAWLEQNLGIAGVTAIGLLVGCAAFYHAGLRPAKEQAAGLRAALERSHARGERPAATGEEALAVFYRNFSGGSALDALHLVLEAAALERVAIDLGEYRVARERGAKLTRYQITLPVKGEYRAVRRFVARALNDVPGLALDGLALRRESVAATTVEARVQLTLYIAERRERG